MAKIILDVPDEKLKPFLQSILNLGIEKHIIDSKVNSLMHPQKKIDLSSHGLLSGWEFFSNELEYE